jgi:Spermidine/putrescine-binding periplasmic protein
MANAKNVEAAHALAKWVSTAEGSAAWASAFSANPVGKGGIDLTSEDVKEVLRQRLSWRCAAEAVVVAHRGGLVHQATRQVRRLLEGRLIATGRSISSGPGSLLLMLWTVSPPARKCH